ncbi:MAG: proton-conducting transporter membrane subunit [Candidatus Jordarchaeaceae archaeon]
MVSVLGVNVPLLHILNRGIRMDVFHGCWDYSEGYWYLKRGGLSGKMPATSIALAIGSLGLIGLPPFNGFWSKLLLILAPVQLAPFTLNGWVWVTLALVAVLCSGFSAVYYLRLIQIVWFGKESAKVRELEKSRAPVWMLVAIVLLAVGCVAFGLFPGVLYAMSNRAAEALFYLPAYFGGIL